MYVMRTVTLRCKLFLFVSTILLTCYSYAGSSEECKGEEVGLAELNVEYFMGQWYIYDYNEEDLSTTTEKCTFEKSGSYSCEVTERGPMNKDNTLFHTDTYWEKGKWRVENNKFYKQANKWPAPVVYDIQNASKHYFHIIRGEQIKHNYYRSEGCAKSSQ